MTEELKMMEQLTQVARKAENLSTLLSDIEEDFFGEGLNDMYIVSGYPRLRRYIAMCFDLSYNLTKELHDNDIWCFDRKAVV